MASAICAFTVAFRLSTSAIAIAIIITTIPMAIAAIPIFIIGAETLLLYALLPIMRLAIKNSKFKLDYAI